MRARYNFGLATICLMVGTLSGCAGVTFYSSPDLKDKTGIPVYGSSPYLLVSRTGKADKPVETSIVYITDPGSVIYARPRSGFGSSNLTLALSGGQLTSFGQQTDTKIPELVTSLAGLVTARATADKLGAEADAVRAAGGTQQSAAISTEASDEARGLADDIANSLGDQEFLGGLIPQERIAVTSAQAALTAISQALANPGNLLLAPLEYEKLKAVGEALSAEVQAPDGTSTRRNAALQRVQAWVAKIGSIHAKAIKDIPAPPAPPPFELYKIILSPNGTTILQRVVSTSP